MENAATGLFFCMCSFSCCRHLPELLTMSPPFFSSPSLQFRFVAFFVSFFTLNLYTRTTVQGNWSSCFPLSLSLLPNDRIWTQV